MSEKKGIELLSYAGRHLTPDHGSSASQASLEIADGNGLTLSDNHPASFYTSFGTQLVRVCLTLIYMMWVGGCEEEVAAPNAVDQPFSMYGIINPRLNQQTLLVSPIEPLLFDYSDSIDAVVTSTDLETGKTVVWRDTLVVGERGQIDHVFVAQFRPDFGSIHRIEAARSDGAVSWAEAHIPKRPHVLSEDVGSHFVDVHVSGDDFHLLEAEVIYTVRFYDAIIDDPCMSQARAYAISYVDRLMETDDGYRFRINLGLDHDRVMRLFPRMSA